MKVSATALIRLALVSLAVVALDAVGLPLGPVRVVAGVILALFVPGAAVMLALRPPFLAGSARLILAVPISVALQSLVGVVLDWTPWGLRPLPLVLASTAVTMLLLAGAVRREWRLGRGAREVDA